MPISEFITRKKWTRLKDNLVGDRTQVAQTVGALGTCPGTLGPADYLLAWSLNPQTETQDETKEKEMSQEIVCLNLE